MSEVAREVIDFTRDLLPGFEYTVANPNIALESGFGNCATRGFVVAKALIALGESPEFYISRGHGQLIADLRPFQQRSARRLDPDMLLGEHVMGHVVVLSPERSAYFENTGSSDICVVGFRDSQRVFNSGQSYTDPLEGIASFCEQHPASLTTQTDILEADAILEKLIAERFSA